MEWDIAKKKLKERAMFAICAATLLFVAFMVFMGLMVVMMAHENPNHGPTLEMVYWWGLDWIFKDGSPNTSWTSWINWAGIGLITAGVISSIGFSALLLFFSECLDED